MIGSQFPVGSLIFKHMVNNHKESMSYRRNSLLLPSANHQPVIKSGQIGPFLSSGCPSGFDQISAQPSVSLPSPPAFAFSGALIVARTKSRPRGRMSIGGKTGHVYPDLRK